MIKEKSIYSTIKACLVTEKSTKIAPLRKYIFWVERGANKIEIKRAVEKIYNVKVQDVTSMIIKGRMKKIRWNQPGKTPSQKKAIVTLKEGFEIKPT